MHRPSAVGFGLAVQKPFRINGENRSYFILKEQGRSLSSPPYILRRPVWVTRGYRKHPPDSARFLLCSLDLTHHVTGCPFMTASAIQFFLPHTCQFMETLLSTSLSSFISTPPLRPASRSLIDVSRPRDSKATRYGQRTLRNVAPSLWNALPGGIR